MDLRISGVNAASSTPERQVLPSVFDHGRDLAALASDWAQSPSETDVVETMVLDFKDAFMSVPLAEGERPFNTCALEVPVRRSRPELYPGEPEVGSIIAWRVLGFGGKSNPLVYSRCAGFASRTAQALLHTRRSNDTLRTAPGRIQLYVDDPAVSCVGPRAAVTASFDIIILWWMLLGIPLALTKGSRENGVHRWIGADFTLRSGPSDPEAVISVPPAFAAELLSLLLPFASGQGHVAEATTEKMLGKAGRLAYIVPTARPYVTALWGALGGARAAREHGKREAPPGRVPARRFAQAATWLATLFDPRGYPRAFPLEQVVCLRLPELEAKTHSVMFDASPWGGGALLLRDSTPAYLFELSWTAAAADSFGTVVGVPASQTSFEYLTLYLA